MFKVKYILVYFYYVCSRIYLKIIILRYWRKRDGEKLGEKER